MISLEKMIQLLEDANQNKIKIIAESRGKAEDKDLEQIFYRIGRMGTENVDASRFREIQIELIFRPKSMNIIGTQLADLIAYPIARYVLSPGDQSQAFDNFKGKFYSKNERALGFKIFP